MESDSDYPQPDSRRVIITTGTPEEGLVRLGFLKKFRGIITTGPPEEDLVRLCFLKKARKIPTVTYTCGRDDYNDRIQSIVLSECIHQPIELLLLGSYITPENVRLFVANPKIAVTIINWNNDSGYDKYRGLGCVNAMVDEVINDMPNWVNILAYPNSNDPITARYLRRGIDNYAVTHGLELWQVYDLMLDSKADDPLIDDILRAGNNLHQQTVCDVRKMISDSGLLFNTASCLRVRLVEVAVGTSDYLCQCYLNEILDGDLAKNCADVGVLVSYSAKKTTLFFGVLKERENILINMLSVEKPPFNGCLDGNRGDCVFPGRWSVDNLVWLIKSMG